LVGLERLQFRLAAVSHARLAGIDLARKRVLADFTLSEAAQLLSAYRAGKVPLELTLEIAVRNPNDGQAGRRRLPITLARLDWRLFLDSVPTLSGSLAQPVEVPAAGEVLLPLTVQLELRRFFQERSYEDLLRLALGIAGAEGNPGRVTLEVEPTLSTPVGQLRYPHPVRVVHAEFRP
jgi:hypothetical protein